MDTPGPLARLLAAIERRDIDGIVECFTTDYRNETPAHPARGFTGRDQVRRNWEQILAAVPDVEARIVEWVRDGDVVWTEWRQGGTRRDGQPFEMRGVVIFTLAADEIAAARFYLEPLDRGDGGIGAAVRGQVGSTP
jgi:ketosteroid isomerase-like protein